MRSRDILRRQIPKEDLVRYVALTVLAIGPYIGTLGNLFVYDDDLQILENPYLRSFKYLGRILASSVWSFRTIKSATNYYRPLMSLQYFVMYQLFGALAYPYHLANLILNAGVVFLVYRLTIRLSESKPIAFVAAALFALHPIHSEVVAWVAAVPDLQLAFFVLLAFSFYLGSNSQLPSRRWEAVAGWFSFALALLAKEPAIVFPVLLICYEHFVRADRESTAFSVKARRYAPFWVITLLYLVGRIASMGAVIPTSQGARIPWTRALLSGVSLFGNYVVKFFWPSHLDVFYPFVQTSSALQSTFLLGVGILTCYSGALILLWRTNRFAAFGLVWFALFLAPSLNARWMPANVFAERYLYLPSVGMGWTAAILIAWAWDRVFGSRPARLKLVAASALGFVVLLVLTVRIVKRTRDWHDDISLFRSAVASHPQQPTPHAHLGLAYWMVSRRDLAVQEWRAALQLDPRNIFALDYLAQASLVQGAFPEALRLSEKAIALDPNGTNSRLARAGALEGLGRTQDAEVEYRTAVEMSPFDWEVRNRLAAFYLASGRREDAETEYKGSLEILPSSEALDILGDLAVQRQKAQDAETYFRRAEELDAYDHHAHYQLALIYAQSSRIAQARHEYELGYSTEPGTDPLGPKVKTLLESASLKRR